jgi:hypothetical protein
MTLIWPLLVSIIAVRFSVADIFAPQKVVFSFQISVAERDRQLKTEN